MSLELKDILIERPITLCLWKSKADWQKIKNFFEKDTEVKMISHPEEISKWITINEIHNIVVGLDDLQEMKEIKTYLDVIPLERRRKLFVVLVSPKLHTLDPRESFIYSVNLVINTNDLDETARIFQKSKLYWENLYRDFHATYMKIMEVS